MTAGTEDIPQACGRPCLLACAYFHDEISALLRQDRYKGVLSAPFPARCGGPPLDWDDLSANLPAGTDGMIVMGQACLAQLGLPPATAPRSLAVSLPDCFSLVADRAFLDQERQAGTYVMTPGWLAGWRERFTGWGFDDPRAFGEFASQLLLLDTGTRPTAEAELLAMGQALGLPVRRIAIGLDHLAERVDAALAEWRLRQARQALTEVQRARNQDMADHAASMDFFAALARSVKEDEVVTAMEDLFRMLFAPRSIRYIPAAMDAAEEPIAAQSPGYSLTEDGTGFVLDLIHNGRLRGRLIVEGLAFPAHRERYLTQALGMVDVCGLALDNVHQHQRLIDMEKMAALGVMVAGVAHEINTPLGSSLLAASAFSDRTGKLTGAYRQGRLTQTDLERYLDQAGKACSLIRVGLDRIAALVEVFRKVAMNESIKPDQRRINVHDCIANVLRILTDRLPRTTYDVEVHCAKDLEITGNLGDWTNILANFVTNSLTHGFRGREHGVIDIEAFHDDGWFKLIYRDDGNGMSPEVLKRIFDPFYTTDNQRGMGLGLHLVYNIVTRRLGGSIRCRSRENEGAAFEIEVPLGHQPAPPAIC